MCVSELPVATAAAAATTTAIAAPAPATAAPRSALGLGTGLVDGDCATADFLQVQRLNRGVRLILVGHLHESKSPRPAGHLVHDDRYGRDFAMRLEGLTDVILGRLVRQVAHVDVRHLQPRNRKETYLGGQDRKKRTSCRARTPTRLNQRS